MDYRKKRRVLFARRIETIKKLNIVLMNMKKLKERLGRFYKLVFFIVFTILWTLFVYAIDGEWLYFIPLFVGDHLFWHTFNYTFWKKRVKKKKSKNRC